MNILFRSKNIELQPEHENFMARRLENLGKFFSPHVHIYVDVNQTRGGHLGSHLFYVSIHIEDGKTVYFADEYEENFQKSFNKTFGDIFRIIRNDRSKSRRLLKTTGRGFKKIFKNKYK